MTLAMENPAATAIANGVLNSVHAPKLNDSHHTESAVAWQTPNPGNCSMPFAAGSETPAVSHFAGEPK